jgi:hypothetical protein
MALLNGNKQTLDNAQLQVIKDEIDNNPSSKDYTVLSGKHNGLNVGLLNVKPLISNPEPQATLNGPSLISADILTRAFLGVVEIGLIKTNQDGANIWETLMNLPTIDLNSLVIVDFINTLGPLASVWGSGETYIIGDKVCPVVGDGIFLCEDGGKAGLAEPDWPEELGGTIADGDAQWKRLSGKNGKNLLSSAKIDAISALGKIPDPAYQALIPGQSRAEVLLGVGYVIEGEDITAAKAL